MNITGIEYLPDAQLAKLRQRRWQSQGNYVLKNSKFFAEFWDGFLPPQQLEDLPELPLCEKVMLRKSQAENPPFGDYLAAADDQVIRLHRTSGSTGDAMNVALTKFDAEQTAQVGARSHRAAGVKAGRQGRPLSELSNVDGRIYRPSLCRSMRCNSYPVRDW